MESATPASRATPTSSTGQEARLTRALPCCSSPVWCGQDSVHLQPRRHGCVSFRRTVCCIPWQRRGFCCSAPSKNRSLPLLASAFTSPEHGGRRWWTPHTLSLAAECLTRYQAQLPMQHCHCRLPPAS